MAEFKLIDDFLSAGLLRAVAATWPPSNWSHWHLYRDDTALKLASKDAHRLPDAARLALGEMAKLDVSEFASEGFPDLDLYGAGLHSILPGGHLGLHLDGAVHPLHGWRREVNAVLFVDDWQPEWGGCLEFWESEISGPIKSIPPKRNRLVLFATGGDAWHRVAQVTGPQPRRTVSLFWWSLAPAESKRDRAEFAHSQLGKETTDRPPIQQGTAT